MSGANHKHPGVSATGSASSLRISRVECDPPGPWQRRGSSACPGPSETGTLVLCAGGRDTRMLPLHQCVLVSAPEKFGKDQDTEGYLSTWLTLGVPVADWTGLQHALGAADEAIGMHVIWGAEVHAGYAWVNAELASTLHMTMKPPRGTLEYDTNPLRAIEHVASYLRDLKKNLEASIVVEFRIVRSPGLEHLGPEVEGRASKGRCCQVTLVVHQIHMLRPTNAAPAQEKPVVFKEETDTTLASMIHRFYGSVFE